MTIRADLTFLVVMLLLKLKDLFLKTILMKSQKSVITTAVSTEEETTTNKKSKIKGYRKLR